MPHTPTTRILDASANRATEGLRVVEDYTRFALDDAHLTQLCKQLRHDLATTCADLPHRPAARDTPHDVGTTITTPSESNRLDPLDVCLASLQRTKQSLRSLEEYSKISSPKLAPHFESQRYRLYTLEKSLLLTQENRLRLRNTNLCVLITGQESPTAFTTLVKKLVDTGVGMIQLRDSQLPDTQLVERAKTLVAIAKNHPDAPPLTIINDRPDLAAAAHADGVHLGQDDLPLQDARALLGPRKLIGISTHSLDQARRARLDGANYLGAGPTFPSTTKSFDHFPGLDYLQQVAAQVTLPTFAIGGIHPQNLPKVLETGITRIAVSSAARDASELLTLLHNQPSPASE